VLLELHVCPEGQVPQLRLPPQPSAIDPHVALRAAHVVGTHAWQVPDAEQVWPLAQVPHWSVPPQPSDADPHVLACAAHVDFVHVPNGTGFLIQARTSASGRKRTSLLVRA
jgi:hypothetical protein